MTANADQLGSIPCEEGSGRLSDTRRVCQLAKADGAALSLVAKGPAQGKQAGREGNYDLNIVGGLLTHRSAEMGKIDRRKVNDGKDQCELRREKGPAAELPVPR